VELTGVFGAFAKAERERVQRLLVPNESAHVSAQNGGLFS
jgi:hypothetical protein